MDLLPCVLRHLHPQQPCYAVHQSPALRCALFAILVILNMPFRTKVAVMLCLKDAFAITNGMQVIDTGTVQHSIL